MGKIVIDSHAILSILNRENDFEKILGIIKEAQREKNEMLMSVVNFGEVYYTVLRRKGEEQAEKLQDYFSAIPVFIIDVDVIIAKQAARFKAFKRMSYADCHAAALAFVLKAPVLTGDKEFKEVEGEIKVLWV